MQVQKTRDNRSGPPGCIMAWARTREEQDLGGVGGWRGRIGAGEGEGERGQGSRAGMACELREG